MSYIAVFTTTDQLQEAQILARELVKQKLVACAQISEIESFYTWQNEFHQTKEYRLVCKSTEENYPRIEQEIIRLHSYEVPAIYALNIDYLSEPFRTWISENTLG